MSKVQEVGHVPGVVQGCGIRLKEKITTKGPMGCQFLLLFQGLAIGTICALLWAPHCYLLWVLFLL